MKPSAVSLFAILFLALFSVASCTDNSTAQKAQKLEEQNKALLARIEDEQKQRQTLEKSVAELRQQMEQAQQATERRTGEQWNGLIDQILVKLERRTPMVGPPGAEIKMDFWDLLASVFVFVVSVCASKYF